MIVTEENKPSLEFVLKEEMLKGLRKLGNAIPLESYPHIQEFLPEIKFILEDNNSFGDYAVYSYKPFFELRLGDDIDFGFIMAKIRYVNKQHWRILSKIVK